MEVPLVIGPFIESRRSNNRPQEKTADQAQDKDVHIVGCSQYANDAAITQSIAGVLFMPGRSAHDARSEPKGGQGFGVEEGRNVRVGGART